MSLVADGTFGDAGRSLLALVSCVVRFRALICVWALIVSVLVVVSLRVWWMWAIVAKMVRVSFSIHNGNTCHFDAWDAWVSGMFCGGTVECGLRRLAEY